MKNKNEFTKKLMDTLMTIMGDDVNNKFFGLAINYEIVNPIVIGELDYIQSSFVTITKLDMFNNGELNEFIGGCHVIRFFNDFANKNNISLDTVFFGDVYGEVYDKMFIGQNIKPEITSHPVTSIVFVEKLLIKEEYRGIGLSHKILQNIIKTFGENESTLIILHAKTPQKLFQDENVSTLNTIKNSLYENFKLNRFDNDEEFGKYKLYSLCKSYGFDRLDETDLFYYHSADKNEELKSLKIDKINK